MALLRVALVRAILTAVVVLLVIVYFPERSDTTDVVEFANIPPETATEASTPNRSSNLPMILFWTGFFFDQNRLKQQAANHIKDCPYNCSVENDRSLVRGASAVVFHPYDLTWKDIPKIRSPNQRYVYLSQECPMSHLSLVQGLGRGFNHPSGQPFWNWTMTYRLDSDIWIPYEQYYKDGKNQYPMTTTEVEDLVTKKSDPVAWFVSNCHAWSPRGDVYSQLKEHVRVTVFGKCYDGIRNCSTKEPWCEGTLGKYFFYLAFPNAICNDYVTEKLARAVRLKTVPIVLRRKDVEAKLLPGSAFIAVDDFKSVRDLADHLNFLMSNKTAYTEYYRWRLSGPTGDMARQSHIATSWCGLCTKLHTSTLTKYYRKLPFGTDECRNRLKSIRNW